MEQQQNVMIVTPDQWNSVVTKLDNQTQLLESIQERLKVLNTEDGSELLSRKEACNILGISPSKYFQLVNSGVITLVYPNGCKYGKARRSQIIELAKSTNVL